MPRITPFADDARSIGIGNMTVENGTSRLSIYGSLQIQKTSSGLALARELSALAAEIVKSLEEAGELPDELPPAVIDTAPNPFG